MYWSQYFWFSSCVLPEATRMIVIFIHTAWMYLFESHHPKRINVRLRKTVSRHLFSPVSVHVGRTLLWVVWPDNISFWFILGRTPTGLLWPIWFAWWPWSLSYLSMGGTRSGVFWPKGCCWLVEGGTPLLRVFWPKFLCLKNKIFASYSS